MNNNIDQKPKYGLISMIALIVGTVIGSGIYVKNASVMNDTQSATLSIIAWTIAALLVLAILVAFLEIASITTKRGEQGTMNSWARYFWSPKTSSFVTVYFIFIYFPLVASSETIYAVDEIFQGKEFNSQMGSFFLISALSFALLVIAFMLATFFMKTTKSMMGSGTVLTLLPLFLIILLVIILASGGSVSSDGDANSLNPIFNKDDIINSGLEGGFFNNFSQILLVLPAILFAFDGFLYSASLSTEAKTDKTYKTAAVFSIIFIAIIYIVFSLASYSLADTSIIDPETGGIDSSTYEVTSIMSFIFPKNAWIKTTISIIIAFAIMTTVFGYSIAAMWTLADASNTNEIVDKNGNLIKRHKNGNPYKSGLRILYYSMLALLFIRFYDLVALFAIGYDGGTAYVGMTDYISNLYTVLDFSFYSLIIIGALINRKTNKVDVDKSSLFLGAAIFAVVGMGFIVLDMTYEIFNDMVRGIISHDRATMNLAIIQLTSIIAIIGGAFTLYFMQDKNIKKQPEEVWVGKIPFQQAYSQHMTYEEFVASTKK